jgi:DNA-binding MarR family transcriptional regulator
MAMTEVSSRDEEGRTARAGDRDRVELAELDDYIGFHLRMAQTASFKAFRRLTGERKLRPGWFAVLSIIHNNPGITPKAVSRASGRDKSTITPVLRDLMAKRLVLRRPIPSDRRSYALHLTEAGEVKLSHLAACAVEHDRELDAIVGDKKPDLIRLLRRIATALD